MPNISGIIKSLQNILCGKIREFALHFSCIAENGWNLDIKNPFVKEEKTAYTTAELLDMLSASFKKSDALLAELRDGLTQ